MNRLVLRPVPPRPTRRHALFLDFDGTLVEHTDHPDLALVPEQLIGLLAGLDRRLGGAVAIVSGRRLESIDAKLAPIRLRGAGLHGAQLRADPAGEIVEGRPLTELVAQLHQQFGAVPGIWIEDKGAAVAVHYGEVPERAEDIRAAMTALSAQERLEVIAGRNVFEALSRGQGKDVAVRNLMRESPFRNRIPIFLGDDVSDEAGIREAQVWGGISVKIGPGDTEAGWRLEGPAAVFDWLRELLWSLPDD